MSTPVCTYAYRKVRKFFDLHDHIFELDEYTSDYCREPYADGCFARVKDTEWVFSVQTAPIITGSEMCEIALLWKEDVVKIEELGFQSVMQYKKLVHLASHLMSIIPILQEKQITDFSNVQYESDSCPSSPTPELVISQAAEPKEPSEVPSFPPLGEDKDAENESPQVK